MTLRIRARCTFLAHMYKAVFRRYHHEMVPALTMLIPPDAVIFDVGAHAGQYCKIFSRLSPKGRVYAFEPATYAFTILAIMCWLKRLRNVVLIKKGLGCVNSKMALNIPLKKSGSVGYGLSHLGRPDNGKNYITEEITVTTCDDVLAELHLQRLDFIKMDIEGGELGMLQGAGRALFSLRPVLLIEMNDQALKRSGSDAVKLWDFLHNERYRPFLIINRIWKEIPALLDDIDIFWIPLEKISILALPAIAAVKECDR